jgi:hypothetical protein
MELFKLLFLYLCIALCVSFFFPQIILGSGNTSILGIFNVGINATTNEPYISSTGFSNSDLNNAINQDQSTEQGLFQRGINVVTSFFQFIVDGLGNVLGVVKILFAFLFSPFILVLSPDLLGNAPFYVKLGFAIPLVFLAFMGVISFIRGFR